MKNIIYRDYTRMSLNFVLSANNADHLERSSGHFICQYPAYYRASYETRSSPTFAGAARRVAVVHVSGCTGRAKLSRRLCTVILLHRRGQTRSTVMRRVLYPSDYRVR